jgi:hypothetical protein
MTRGRSGSCNPGKGVRQPQGCMANQVQFSYVYVFSDLELRFWIRGGQIGLVHVNSLNGWTDKLHILFEESGFTCRKIAFFLKENGFICRKTAQSL